MNGTEPEESPPARRVRNGLAVALGVALVALLVHALLLEVFRVEGSSMEPTLVEADRVLVLKVAEPAPGEVVVFKNPLDTSQHVIKRVIARAGERVAIRAGWVTVDGRELGEVYLAHPSDHDGSINLPETTVPLGYLFVLGDNRVASSDSRRFGPIDARLLVGRAVLALWPPRRL